MKTTKILKQSSFVPKVPYNPWITDDLIGGAIHRNTEKVMEMILEEVSQGENKLYLTEELRADILVILGIYDIMKTENVAFETIAKTLAVPSKYTEFFHLVSKGLRGVPTPQDLKEMIGFEG